MTRGILGQNGMNGLHFGILECVWRGWEGLHALFFFFFELEC